MRRSRNHGEVKMPASRDFEVFVDQPTETLLQLYVRERRNIGKLVESDHPPDIAKVKRLTGLLWVKKNNGTITEAETLFFRRLLAAVELDESYNNAPVLQILKEDLLDPGIAKIKNHPIVKRVRKLIARN